MSSGRAPNGDRGRFGRLVAALTKISDLWQLLLFVTPLVIFIAAFALHHQRQISIVVTWAIASVAAATWLTVLAVLLSEHGVVDGIRRHARSILAFCVTAILAAGVLLAGRSAGHVLFGAGCGAPIDLRVATAPENITALRDTVAEYSSGTCRAARVTVAASGGLTAVTAGFQNGWYSTPGAGENGRGALQPDILIPGTTAEATQLAATDHHPGVKLTDEGSIGTSPLAVGVSANAVSDLQSALAGTDRPSLRDLLGKARANGVQQIFRASPDMSEDGMLATTDLYGSQALGTPTATEQLLASTSLPLGDTTSLLCALRRSDRQDRFAVIAPEQVLADYAHGRPLGTACPAGQAAGPKLQVFRPSGTHVLDYPFVHVEWAGQTSPARSREVERFRHWLGTHRLLDQGFRDTKGRPGSGASDSTHVYLGELSPVPVDRFGGDAIDEARKALVASRGPLRVVLAIDVSGSMSGGRSESGSRFTYAVQLARSAHSNAIRTIDTAELDVFSRAAGNPTFRQLVAPDATDSRGRFETALDGLTPTGSDLSLDDAIIAAAGRFKGFSGTSVIVFTDGGSLTDPAKAAGRIRASTKGAAPPIVVLTGTQRCAETPTMKTLGSAVRCVDTVGHDPNDTVTGIFNQAAQATGRS